VYSATASGNYTVIVTIDARARVRCDDSHRELIPSTLTVTPGGPTTFCAGGSVR
jgi:hypothetical protein